MTTRLRLAVTADLHWGIRPHGDEATRLLVSFLEADRLRTKRFLRGRHNDGNFVRWPRDDVTFTAEVVAALGDHLRAALAAVGRAIVVTHHPPFSGLTFPRPAAPAHLDGLLWDAF